MVVDKTIKFVSIEVDNQLAVMLLELVYSDVSHENQQVEARKITFSLKIKSLKSRFKSRSKPESLPL